MSLSLTQLTKQLQSFRQPIVDSDGRMSGDFTRFMYGLISQSSDVIDDAQTAADTAQTAASTAQTSANAAATAASTAQSTANDAALSSVTAVDQNHLWFTTSAGTVPSGDPTVDLTMTFLDTSDASVATRTLRGTLTTAAGTIAVTSVSSAGLATSYTLSGDGTESVTAKVTVTLTNGAKVSARLSWALLDISVEGGLSF